MKFMHLSDLHIGKRVNEFSMLEDQKYILEEILRIVEREETDGVFLAGDIYDKSVPSAEAVCLFDSFLTALVHKGQKVFMISGNHDSAERISFGSELVERSGVYVSPLFHGDIVPVELEDRYGKLRIYLLPFIKPLHVRLAYEDADVSTYQEAMECIMEHIRSNRWDPECRNIILAHQFITGAFRCESEEVSVGGIDQISAEVFEEFDYAALGHIHSPQQIGKETIRYSGTPLKYSFSEAERDKTVPIIEFREKGDVQIRLIPLIPLRDMRKIRGTYLELTARDYYQEMSTDDYLSITLTDEEEIPDALGKLRTIYPNIMKLEYDNQRTRANQMIEAVEKIEEKTPMQLFEELYLKQNNREMSEEQRNFVEELIRGIWQKS